MLSLVTLYNLKDSLSLKLSFHHRCVKNEKKKRISKFCFLIDQKLKESRFFLHTYTNEDVDFKVEVSLPLAIWGQGGDQ